MPRVSYVNGKFIPHNKAVVSIDDRALYFADGVYEVIAFYNHILLDGDAHFERFARSLKELSIAAPMPMKALKKLMEKLIARNAFGEGMLYAQVSRGIAPRNHPFPKDTKPSLIMTVAPMKKPAAEDIRAGVSVISHPDIRWGRCDIKSIALLPNVLAKQAATAAGAKEAWLVDSKGVVTEGSASNSYIVTKKGELLTHPKSPKMLGGITRDVVLALAKKAGIKVKERAFTLKKAFAAREAFLTNTTQDVLPIVNIDGKKIGSGKPGEVTRALLAAYHQHIFMKTGKKWRS